MREERYGGEVLSRSPSSADDTAPEAAELDDEARPELLEDEDPLAPPALLDDESSPALEALPLLELDMVGILCAR